MMTNTSNRFAKKQEVSLTATFRNKHKCLFSVFLPIYLPCSLQCCPNIIYNNAVCFSFTIMDSINQKSDFLKKSPTSKLDFFFSFFFGFFSPCL